MTKSKILIVGNLTGWMGWHLELFRRGFEELGHTAELADYHRMARPLGIPLPSGKYETAWRNFQLERLLRSFQPQVLIFVASLKFDTQWIRSFYPGQILFCEYDGWKILNPVLDKLKSVDRVFTTSREIVLGLKKYEIPCSCVPGAVDTQWYCPGTVTERERAAYGSPVAFVGRSTPHRVAYCSAIADCGLTVYGKRWCNEEACAPGGVLEHAIRYRRDVTPEEVRSIYRSSGAIINILREGMDLLSLQGFDVPACGACLCNEMLPDLETFFDIGSEILAFASPEELREIVQRINREPDFARKIGENGRKRCLAQYTFKHRAERILKALE